MYEYVLGMMEAVNIALMVLLIRLYIFAGGEESFVIVCNKS
jgi:hypothetical protein